jgi:hypothetical protein
VTPPAPRLTGLCIVEHHFHLLVIHRIHTLCAYPDIGGGTNTVLGLKKKLTFFAGFFRRIHHRKRLEANSGFVRQSRANKRRVTLIWLYMKSNLLLFCLLCLCGFAPSRLPAATTFSIFPAATTNDVGDSIQLSLQRTGDDSQPFAFQWSKDGTNLVEGDRISGVQTPVLIINQAQMVDSGSYSLSFSNAVGSNITLVTVSSQVYVIGAPIIEDLYMQTIGLGIRFTVVASGGLLSYQWTWQGQAIPGATNSTLNYADVYTMANAGFYAVRVSNPAAPEGVTSDPYALSLTKPAPSGTYQGLFFQEDAVTTEACGFFQYTLTAATRAYSGKITMGATAYRFSGAFSPLHESSIIVSRSDGPPLALRLQLLTLNNAPEVTGSVSDGHWTVPLSGNRLYFGSKNPTPLVGKYTLVLQNTNTSNSVPNGSGYGAVVIQKGGQLTFKGRAADGSAVSQSCGLSRSGDWPLYLRANQNRGRMIGWLTVTNQAGGSISGGKVAWVKDAGADELYPQGFSLALQPKGSTYIKPISTPILAMTNGVAGFFGGDLSGEHAATWDFVKVVLKPPANFQAEEGAEGVRLSINKSNGSLTGSFINIATGVRTPIRGAILQQQNSAHGYFLSTDSSGTFTLFPSTSN